MIEAPWASDSSASVSIPGWSAPLRLELPPDLAALRTQALAWQREPPQGLPEIELADARAWTSHTSAEDWLVWRGRRCRERLASLSIELAPGERVVGRPCFRPARADGEEAALAAARAALRSMPPFPGGDAGHFHPDYDTLLTVGVGGLLDQVDSLAATPGLGPEQRSFYLACRLALEGLEHYLVRLGQACAAMATAHPAQAAAWADLARICQHVSRQPPATFHQAIQLLWATLVALWFGEDHGLTSPGRLDQILRPFYLADRAAGRLEPRTAFELICSLYIQLNRILHPGSANSVLVGGRDRAGVDVTSDLTYLCLAARQATRLVYPTVGLVWHAGTPSALMDFAVRQLGTGVGDPAFFNDEVISAGLRDHGVSPADSHSYMNSTCVEIKVVGASHMWVTAPYFNLPQALLEVLADVDAGRVPEPGSLEQLQALVRERLAATVRRAAVDLDRVWRERAHGGGFPLASCLIADCLLSARDFDRGGARYNWVENSFVGLANLVDSLLAIGRLVYAAGDLDLRQLHQVLVANYAGHEPLRQRLIHAMPHYGNDLDEADELAAQWSQFLIETTRSNTVGGHPYVPGFFCWIMHEQFGNRTGATPDGRLAGWPLADGAGAAQGRERRGPTAAVLSTTRWSHRAALGGLVHNLKFSSTAFRTDADCAAVRKVIETYLQRGGFELQVNVVGREVLRAAQANPEQYQDLLVRVAGYSDYFVHLGPKMQEEVIARTEHTL